MLEEELGAGEEGHAVPRRGRGDGGEVLESGHFGDGLFDAVDDLFFEEEETVVVHGHCFRRGDGAGFRVRVHGVFDGLPDAEGPGLHGAGVVGLGFEDVLVRGVGEPPQDDGRAGFGQRAHFAHVHVVEGVPCVGVAGADDNPRRVDVVEFDVHAGPVEEVGALSEV